MRVLAMSCVLPCGPSSTDACPSLDASNKVLFCVCSRHHESVFPISREKDTIMVAIMNENSGVDKPTEKSFFYTFAVREKQGDHVGNTTRKTPNGKQKNVCVSIFEALRKRVGLGSVDTLRGTEKSVNSTSC